LYKLEINRQCFSNPIFSFIYQVALAKRQRSDLIWYSSRATTCVIRCFFCSFICLVASARLQRSDLFGLRVKLPPVTARYNPVKCLAQGHNKRTFQLGLHIIPLNVNQGSCEYLLFKAFGLTHPGNRTQVYRIRGGRFKHSNARTRRLRYKHISNLLTQVLWTIPPQ